MSFPRRKLLLGVCAAATVLIPALRTTVLSFALALFLAGCLQRPMIRLQRRGVPRVISAPAFLLLGLVPLIAMLAGGIFYGLRGVQQLAGTLLPLLGTRPAGEDWLYRLITALPPSVQDVCFAMLDKLAGQGDALAGELLQRLALWSSEALTALPKKMGSTGLFLLFFLFCAIGYPELHGLLERILPEDWRIGLGKIQRITAARLGLWLRAESKLVVLIALELAIGLAALRVDHWGLLAVFIALVDLLPMIGSGLILLPWALVCLLLGEHLPALGLGLLWLCVWLTRTLLEPRLVGRQLQLPTAISFLTAVLGLRLWGLKGLILFPVLAAAAVSFFPETESK
ncbi:MAG: AI-2E family transporter [Eubacteriales bacterium]|nr:AI-2E family transporter [Eubacteriales bacterium]